MGVTVTERVSVKRRINQIEGGVPVVIRSALEDMKRISAPLTPRKDGSLRADIKIRVYKNKGHIKWGKKYAAAQEAGQMTVKQQRTFKADDGRFVTLKPGVYKFKNYTTPGTGKHFVKRSAKAMMKNYKKYFRRARLSQ